MRPLRFSHWIARNIILGLPGHPVVNAETAAAHYGVTATAARSALNRLEEAGVIQRTRVGRRRDREWISDELFQQLDLFEHDLGRAGEQPGRPGPSPTKPPRRQRGPARKTS